MTVQLNDLDVAALQERVADLERSNRELEEFAYLAAHDLQAPLRIAAGCLEVFERRFGASVDTDGLVFIRQAHDSATHMSALVSGLLAIARIGSDATVDGVVDLDAELVLALTALRSADTGKDVVVHAGDLPSVNGNAIELRQVLVNLLANAVKFHDSGAVEPRVWVRADRQPDEWLITVEDNGVGIDPTQREEAFVMFRRLHKRSLFAGSGIGLALCRRVIERHGGRIWIEGRDGGGTAVRFTLPITPRPQVERSET